MLLWEKPVRTPGAGGVLWVYTNSETGIGPNAGQGWREEMRFSQKQGPLHAEPGRPLVPPGCRSLGGEMPWQSVNGGVTGSGF